jgi:hypothetical protein
MDNLISLTSELKSYGWDLLLIRANPCPYVQGKDRINLRENPEIWDQLKSIEEFSLDPLKDINPSNINNI